MVHIVLVNGKIDEVFEDINDAKLHALNLRKKWNLTEIISKEVRSI